MEENNTLKEKLIEKLNVEYTMLRDELRESGVDNFMERGYEFFTKQEIIDFFQYSEISEDSIKALLKSNDMLLNNFFNLKYNNNKKCVNTQKK